MAVYVVCNACRAALRVKDDFAGRRARCPTCRQVINIPDSAEDTAAPDEEGVTKQLRRLAAGLGIRVADDAGLKEIARAIDEAERTQGRSFDTVERVDEETA